MGEERTTGRKNSHLDLCASAEVEPPENSALLECVHLVHCAMPELAISDVETGGSLFGKRLRFPLVVTGMTGGTERAARVNRELAGLAEKHGLAFGVGSQRAMSENPERASTFRMRDVAPSTVVIGNIGLRQAAELGGDGVRRLADSIQADGMALHLNVGQELTQPEGDRDFRFGYRTVGVLVKAFDEKLLVKETGCGISPEVARRLVEIGVQTIDVSGLGGTSWVRVEQLRAQGVAQEVGRTFSGWGIPTAAALSSVRQAVGSQVTLIASGGIRSGLDVVKVLALGADLAGMALPLFRALEEGGRDGADQAIEVILTGLRQGLLLTGSRDVDQLRARPKVITGKLKEWLAAL